MTKQGRVCVVVSSSFFPPRFPSYRLQRWKCPRPSRKDRLFSTHCQSALVPSEGSYSPAVRDSAAAAVAAVQPIRTRINYQIRLFHYGISCLD